MEGKDLAQTLEDSFLNLADGAVAFIPKLLVALLLLLVGVIVARIFSKLIGKAVNYLENSKPVSATLRSLGVQKMDVDSTVTLFTYWAIILVFLSAAVDVLELQVLTNTFASLVDFIPNILAAAIIAGLSFVAANAIHDIVLEMSHKAKLGSKKVLAVASKIIVLVFGLPLAIAQLGLDLTIITNNITVIVAGFMLAAGIAFGLGGKDAAGKIVDDLYENWKK